MTMRSTRSCARTFGRRPRERAARPGRVQRAQVVRAVLAVVSVSGCFVGTGDISDPTGGTPEPVDHKVNVVVTNAGDGAGAVAVTFPAGAVTNGCSDSLGPGETCTVQVTHTAAIPSASIQAQPDDFSMFVRFGGDCGGTQTQCTISIAETTVTVSVEVVFDLGVARIDFQPDPMVLAVGADGSLTAAAFADAEGDLPVAAATFTWQSSDQGIATVRAEAGGSATVSGVATGEAWIRAAARNGRDSVKVVVGG